MTPYRHGPTFHFRCWLKIFEWSSGSVLPSYVLTWLGILVFGRSKLLIRRVNGSVYAHIYGLDRSWSSTYDLVHLDVDLRYVWLLSSFSEYSSSYLGLPYRSVEYAYMLFPCFQVYGTHQVPSFLDWLPIHVVVISINLSSAFLRHGYVEEGWETCMLPPPRRWGTWLRLLWPSHSGILLFSTVVVEPFFQFLQLFFLFPLLSFLPEIFLRRDG